MTVLAILCVLVLAVAYVRRRRQNRKRTAQWNLEAAARRAYVPWDGTDPFADDFDDDRPPPAGPRLMN